MLVTTIAAISMGCTTKFERDKDGDVSTDVSGETSPDAEPDATPDAEPDATPTSFVSCEKARDVTVPYEGDASLDWGCTTDSCSDVNIWMGFDHNALIAITGAERVDGEWRATYFASPVDTAGTVLVSPPAMELVVSRPDDESAEIRSSSLVRNHRDQLILLHPTRYHAGGGTEPSQGIGALNVWSDTDLNLYHDYQQVMPYVDPRDEPDRIHHMRAARRANDLYIFFVVETEGTGGPSFTQLYGGTVAIADYWAGATFTYGDVLRPIQPGRTQIGLPHRIEVALDGVLLPWMQLVMSGVSGEYHSMLWVFDEPIPGGGSTYVPHVITLDSSRDFDGWLTVADLPPHGDVAMAAVASNALFNMEGAPPPYELNVAVTDDLTPMEIASEMAGEVVDPVMRNPDNMDLEDVTILHDPVLDVFHYQIVLFPEGENATLFLYSFFPDGSPAWGPHGPFTLDTGSHMLPTFDAVIHPESGAIYMANLTGPGTHGAATSYQVVEIACELVTE